MIDTKHIYASLIIVNWNTQNLLLSCLESIYCTLSDSQIIEIIVVDNGSNDDSVEAVRRQYPHVRIIENCNNLGFAKANNIGILESKGEYACLVNSDVQLLPGCFKKLVNYMERNRKVGIAGPQILWPDFTIQDSCRKFPSLWTKVCETFALDRLFSKSAFFSGEHMRYFSHDKVANVDSIAGCFLMIRRDALNQVGLLDEQFFIYAEETDLCKRFRKYGWQVAFYPEATAIHNCRSSSSKDPIRFSMEQEKSVMRYWRKHHSSLERVFFVILLFMHHTIRYLWSFIRYVITAGKMRDSKERMAFHRARIIALMTLQDSKHN